MLDILRILIKAKDVRERNVIDDFGGCQPIHLLLENVAQAFFGVRELLLHLLALIQPLDDFRDIKARFHIEVNVEGYQQLFALIKNPKYVKMRLPKNGRPSKLNNTANAGRIV